MRRWNVSPAVLATLATLAALAIHAPSANAAGFDLRWNACAADAGVSNRNFACDTDVGTHTLVASFMLDQPISDLVFIDAVIDFIVADNQPVPPWWENFGCRFFSISANATIDPSAVNCTDWSGGVGVGALIGFNHEGSIAPADTASHRRIIVAAGADPPGVNVNANQEYFLFNLVIDNALTTDPGGCAGCSQPVCIVLNSLRFLNNSAAVTQLATPNVAGGNFATWQGGSGANCTAVPARRSTWGQVKALYR